MFFGLEVKSNQSKPLILENTTKLSQAVLEPSKNGKKEPVSLVAEYNNKQFILCVLDPNLSWQCPLDLLFEGGAEVKFSLRGTGTVHLTGYEPLDDYDDVETEYTISGSSSEEEEMEATPSKNKKQVALPNGTGTAKSPVNVKVPAVKRKAMLKAATVPDDEEDEDDEDDEDFDLVKLAMEDTSDEGDDSDIDESDLDDEDDDDSDEEDDDDDEDDEDACEIEEMSEDSD